MTDIAKINPKALRYEERGLLESQLGPVQQKAFTKFLADLQAHLPGWELSNEYEHERTWGLRYNGNRATFKNDLGRLSIQCEYSFFEPLHGRLKAHAYFDHSLRDFTYRKGPYEMSVTLTKGVERIAKEIQSRLLESFAPDYIEVIAKRDEYERSSLDSYAIVKRLEKIAPFLNREFDERKPQQLQYKLHAYRNFNDNDLARTDVTVNLSSIDILLKGIDAETAEKILSILPDWKG